MDEQSFTFAQPSNPAQPNIGRGASLSGSECLQRILFSGPIRSLSNTDITTDVTAGDVIVTMVFDVDAQAEGRGRQELAAERAEQLKDAIRQYGVDHSTHNLVKASGFALLTTVIFLALLFLIQKTYRFSRSRLEAWIDKDSSVLIRKYGISIDQLARSLENWFQRLQ